MLQLSEETQIALIQVLKNSSLYATKIKGVKWFEDKGHDCVTCCANITYTRGDKKGHDIKFYRYCFQTSSFQWCSLKHEPKLYIAPILQDLKL